MSRNAHEDHKRFQRLTAGYTKSLMEDCPSVAKRDWVVRCSLSYDVFFKMFPTSSDRESAINRFIANRQIVRESSRRCDLIKMALDSQL